MKAKKKPLFQRVRDEEAVAVIAAIGPYNGQNLTRATRERRAAEGDKLPRYFNELDMLTELLSTSAELWRSRAHAARRCLCRHWVRI